MRRWMCAVVLVAGCAPRPWSPQSYPAETLDLRVLPMAELDGGTHADRGALREQALAREPRLKGVIPAHYDGSSRSLWSSVEDKALWNGSVGVFQGTAETQAQTVADGPSLDSVFLLNPFVLGGLTPHFSCFGEKPEGQADWDASQTPKSVTFDGKGRKLVVAYEHRGLLPEYTGQDGAVYHLNLTNAADLGFNAFAVVSPETQGFRGIDNLAGHSFHFDQVYPLSQVYRTDGVPNSSARLANLQYDSEVVVLEQLPARLTLSFWRDGAARLSDSPDFQEQLTVTNRDRQYAQADLRPLRH